MTNENKAEEIAYDNSMSRSIGEIEHYSYDECYAAALEMAEWKDRQLKEYLEKKYKDASNSYDKTEAKFYEDRMDYINEIINELFGE